MFVCVHVCVCGCFLIYNNNLIILYLISYHSFYSLENKIHLAFIRGVIFHNFQSTTNLFFKLVKPNKRPNMVTSNHLSCLTVTFFFTISSLTLRSRKLVCMYVSG